jgi:hypothetical protein
VSEDGLQIHYSTVLGPEGAWRIENEYTQLYDLNTDPRSRNDLARADDESADRLREHTIRRVMEVRELSFPPTHEGELCGEHTEKLRGLGYVN